MAELDGIDKLNNFLDDANKEFVQASTESSSIMIAQLEELIKLRKKAGRDITKDIEDLKEIKAGFQRWKDQCQFQE